MEKLFNNKYWSFLWFTFNLIGVFLGLDILLNDNKMYSVALLPFNLIGMLFFWSKAKKVMFQTLKKVLSTILKMI